MVQAPTIRFNFPQNAASRLKQWFSKVKVSPGISKTTKSSNDTSCKYHMSAPIELSADREEKFTEIYLVPLLKALLDELSRKLKSLEPCDIFDVFLELFLKDHGDTDYMGLEIDQIEDSCCRLAPFLIDQIIKRCIGPSLLNPKLILAKSSPFVVHCYPISESSSRVTKLLYDLRHY